MLPCCRRLPHQRQASRVASTSLRANAGNRSGLPPGPPLGGLAHTLGWVLRPVALMERARQHYGDVFTVRLLGTGRVVFITDPALIKEVFAGSGRLLHAGEGNETLRPLMGSRSLLLLDEDDHLGDRRILLPSFHGRHVRAYEDVVAASADRAVERWPLDRPFALQPEMADITREVIVHVVFGFEAGEAQNELLDALRVLVDRGASVLVSIAGLVVRLKRMLAFLPALNHDFGRRSRYSRFLAARARLDGLVYAEIARRRADAGSAAGEDVLSLLLAARREDGRPLSDRELRDELMTLLVAGHETTATALAWTFELLHRHPRVRARLEAAVAAQDEIYPDAVVREALRLHPVVPIIARRLTAPMALGRWQLPAGTVVAPCIYLVHRRADIYPDPTAFRPERFLDAPPGSFTWLPFGGGTRRCLGAGFALLEMRTVLARVIRQTRLEPVSALPERIVRRGITLAPSSGARAVLRERRRPQSPP